MTFILNKIFDKIYYLVICGSKLAFLFFNRIKILQEFRKLPRKLSPLVIIILRGVILSKVRSLKFMMLTQFLNLGVMITYTRGHSGLQKMKPCIKKKKKNLHVLS